MKSRKIKLISQFVIIIILVLFLGNCRQSSQKLTSKKYKEGFSLKHPSNWQAQILDNTYIWVSAKSDSNSPFIFVYPFFLKKPSPSLTSIQNNLTKLSAYFKEVTIEKKAQIRNNPDESAAGFLFKVNDIYFQGIALCSTQGKSGVLYVMAAPQESFEDHRKQLVIMLESFKFEEPEKKPSSIAAKPKIQYRTFQDPREQAFNLEVPKNWAVEGGTFRRASVDLIHVLQAKSPNQKILIQFNDSNIPVFTAPSPTLAMAGFREGSWYSPGYGVNMMVKRYTPGRYFLTEYLQAQYQPHLSNLRLVSQKDRPDIVANFNRIYRQFMSYGISFTLHAGDAAFRFEHNAEPYVGYGLALTQITQAAGMPGGTWSVALMIIYTCPEAEAETVRQISSHMFQSLKMNPQWVSSQQQIAVNVSQIVTQTNREISNIINESYWTRQGVLDDVNRRFSNYILGVTDVIDPETGEKWKVEAGHNYYWHKDTTNQVVGTEVYVRPEIDFTPLKEF